MPSGLYKGHRGFVKAPLVKSPLVKGFHKASNEGPSEASNLPHTYTYMHILVFFPTNMEVFH